MYIYYIIYSLVINMIGDIETKKFYINDEVVESLCNKFIALDVETTGLDPSNCKITEIGLVEFTNGIKTREYGSLINIGEKLHPDIVEITGITDEMLASAPIPSVVFSEVAEFLKDVLEEKVFVVAHNAEFDMAFIKRALIQYGYLGVINFVDTLNISHKLVKGLNNYKQDTVALFFNIINPQSHRATTDAETCGQILVNLLNVYKNKTVDIEINTPFDKMFSPKIKERGIMYYRNKTIKHSNIDNNSIESLIGGDTIYNVKLSIIDNNLTGVCNCPYEGNCKHMYAVLLEYLNNKGNNHEYK